MTRRPPSPNAVLVLLSALVLLAVLAGGDLRAQSPRPATRGDEPQRAAMLAAEDARGTTEDELAPLLRGLKASPGLQVLALRGLGRLEQPEWVRAIAPLLGSSVPAVREEAANALGQAVSRGDAAPAATPLLARAAIETDTSVRGVLARTLGRLPYRVAEDAQEAERAIVRLSYGPAQRGGAPRAVLPPAALANVAHGLDALARRQARLITLAPETRARLRELARYHLDPKSVDLSVEDAARTRRLAVSALNAAKDVDAALLQDILKDEDAQVRRLGVIVASNATSEVTQDLVSSMLKDDSHLVRDEALRAHGRRHRLLPLPPPAAPVPPPAGAAPAGAPVPPVPPVPPPPTPSAAVCEPAIAALSDPHPYVRLMALDLLGGCAASPAAIARLDALAAQVVPLPGRTPAAASAASPVEIGRALVALARAAPDKARARIGAFASAADWRLAIAAARAARVLKDRPTLEQVASRPLARNDNAMNESLEALQELAGHDADRLFIAALDREDYQVLRTSARALIGTPLRADAAAAAARALSRATQRRQETSRDARMALLELLEQTGTGGNASLEDAVSPLMGDFDPLIAHRTANVLSKWTGRMYKPAPKPLPVQLPTPRELDELPRRAIVRMQGGGTFTLALLPLTAPTNTARFVRLARAGYFNGLTFHRVEPNFVIQGGSPGANEYVGDGPYTRDELDLTSNVRGTVGVSTRGRDTGDGQVYINLLDNVRLDHNFTVFAQITEGMAVADALMEGDVIERIDLESR